MIFEFQKFSEEERYQNNTVRLARTEDAQQDDPVNQLAERFRSISFRKTPLTDEPAKAHPN